MELLAPIDRISMASPACHLMYSEWSVIHSVCIDQPALIPSLLRTVLIASCLRTDSADFHRTVSSELYRFLLVHGQVTIIFVVSVCLSVCLFVCAEFFSAVFDPIWIKLGHMLHARV